MSLYIFFSSDTKKKKKGNEKKIMCVCKGGVSRVASPKRNECPARLALAPLSSLPPHAHSQRRQETTFCWRRPLQPTRGSSVGPTTGRCFSGPQLASSIYLPSPHRFSWSKSESLWRGSCSPFSPSLSVCLSVSLSLSLSLSREVQ